MTNTLISAVIVLFPLLMLVWKTKIAPRGQFFEYGFSVAQTKSIKGLCAVFILLSHVCAYLAPVFPSLLLFKYMGAIMVGGFFFVSGYGLQFGLMYKENYLKGFFRKRMLPLAVPYYIINAFYIVTNHMNTREIIISLFGYNLWFMMAIAIFYIGFFLCGKIFGAKRAPLAMTVFTLCYIVVLHRLYFGFWWFNSCFAFAAGMWICAFKAPLVNFFKRRWLLKTLAVILIFGLSHAYYCRHFLEENIPMLIISIISTVSFAALLPLLSMKISLNNPILSFCGEHSLELYLTHALWIRWLRFGFWYNLSPKIFDSDAVYLLGIIAGTVVMSYIVHIISGLIITKLRGTPPS